jgi:hypothetical protein
VPWHGENCEPVFSMNFLTGINATTFNNIAHFELPPYL